MGTQWCFIDIYNNTITSNHSCQFHSILVVMIGISRSGLQTEMRTPSSHLNLTQVHFGPFRQISTMQICRRFFFFAFINLVSFFLSTHGFNNKSFFSKISWWANKNSHTNDIFNSLYLNKVLIKEGSMS